MTALACFTMPAQRTNRDVQAAQDAARRAEDAARRAEDAARKLEKASLSNTNWLHFSVLGVEQAGASSTQADQRPFFDFWVTRHLPLRGNPNNEEDKLGTFLHWWGNVRLASYPQQINAPLGQFVAAGLGTVVSEVKVNELVQSAEFRTGPDFRIWNRLGKARFSFFGAFGGVGPLNPIKA